MLAMRSIHSIVALLSKTSAMFSPPSPPFSPTVLQPICSLMVIECLLSQEGTTQGSLVPSPSFSRVGRHGKKRDWGRGYHPRRPSRNAVATIPLIKKLPDSVTQVWYADDATALGSVSCLREWWDALARVGPLYGYYSNAAKTWLIAKESCHADAISAFEGTNVNVTCIGRPCTRTLEPPWGLCMEYANNFVSEKVDQWPPPRSCVRFDTALPHPESVPCSFRCSNGVCTGPSGMYTRP